MTYTLHHYIRYQKRALQEVSFPRNSTYKHAGMRVRYSYQIFKEVYSGTTKKGAWVSSPFLQMNRFLCQESLISRIIKDSGQCLLYVPTPSTCLRNNKHHRLQHSGAGFHER
jgi:hypothetical protein